MIPEGIPPVVIDFEKASREWMKNKISVGGGMFVYKSQGVIHRPSAVKLV